MKPELRAALAEKGRCDLPGRAVFIRIGGVLDIDAGIHDAFFCQERCPDFEIGIRRISVFAYRLRLQEQFTIHNSPLSGSYASMLSGCWSPW